MNIDNLKNWHVKYDHFKTGEEAGVETLLTLCNGYMGVRSSLELPSSDKILGTYVAGIYDKPDIYEKVEKFGLIMINKALCPSYAISPDFNQMRIDVEGYSVDFNNCEVVDFHRDLDMKGSVLNSTYTLRTPDGKLTKVEVESFCSKAHLHLFASKVSVTPLNYSGKLTIKFDYTQNTSPMFINRIMDYACKTDLDSVSFDGEIVSLKSTVSETKACFDLAGYVVGEGATRSERQQNGISVVFGVDAKEGKALSYVRLSTLCTSLDKTVLDASEHLKSLIALGYDSLKLAHTNYWLEEWRDAVVELRGDDTADMAMRWNMYVLISLAIEDGTDTSISATGLHGTGYFGHVFWDTEVFMLPFYNAFRPDVTRTLLLYRYNRLDAARTLAKEGGYIGARFPWTSTWQGYDVCPIDWERVGNRELHISADVAFGFVEYLEKTGDTDFYNKYGIETIVETAKYYASKATLESDGKYHLLDVIGPDEYNIHADDNYFTSYLAYWNIKRALQDMQSLKNSDPALYKQIAQKTSYTDEIVAFLTKVRDNMAFPKTVNGVNEQYTGFFDLKDIGKIERDEYNMPLKKVHAYGSDYQILKQPDVVMLHYMFPHEFDREVIDASFKYYQDRCIHGSSLSPSIHAIVGCRLGYYDAAWGYFRLSAYMDILNMHVDKSQKDGIHAACIGGTWATIVYGYGGIDVDSDKLTISPMLPKELDGITFHYSYKGAMLEVDINKDSYTITNISKDKTSNFYTNGENITLAAQESKTFVR